MGPSKRLEPGVLIEMGLLLLATPFLLFPTVFPVGTGLALLSVGVIWLGVGCSTGRFLPATPFNLALFFWLLAVLVGALVSADPELTLPKLTSLLLGMTVWRTLVVRVQTKSHLITAVLFFFARGRDDDDLWQFKSGLAGQTALHLTPGGSPASSLVLIARK